MRRVAAAGLGAAVVLLVSASAASAATPGDPFRVAGSGGVSALNPFRVAQQAPAAAKAPATPATPEKPKPKTGDACQNDDECPAENFCSEKAVCEVIQTRTNVLYLYYHEGTFTELLGLYWAKRGPSAYTVLAPFYWHFWSPKGSTTVIVPGFPISWSSQPGASSFGIWPFFCRSTKFGWALPLFGSFEIADPDQKTSWGSLALVYWWKRSPQQNRDLLIPIFYSSRSAASAFTWALPLTFYWRDKDDKHLLLVPLFYWNGHKNGSSLYSLLGYRTHEGAETTGALAWLYWYGSNTKDGSGYDVLFPLLWSFH